MIGHVALTEDHIKQFAPSYLYAKTDQKGSQYIGYIRHTNIQNFDKGRGGRKTSRPPNKTFTGCLTYLPSVDRY